MHNCLVAKWVEQLIFLASESIRILYLDSRFQHKPLRIEARGFNIGAALAFQLVVGFIPTRKKGKFPAETVGQDYDLEYGTDHIGMHVDAMSDIISYQFYGKN